MNRYIYIYRVNYITIYIYTSIFMCIGAYPEVVVIGWVIVGDYLG